MIRVIARVQPNLFVFIGLRDTIAACPSTLDSPEGQFTLTRKYKRWVLYTPKETPHEPH